MELSDVSTVSSWCGRRVSAQACLTAELACVFLSLVDLHFLADLATVERQIEEGKFQAV